MQPLSQEFDSDEPIIIGDDAEFRDLDGNLVQHQDLPVTSAAVPLSPDLFNRHTIVGGTTGTGKTQLFQQIMQGICARNDKAFILDNGGTLYARFGRKGDIVFNPFDSRFPVWGPELEIRTYADCKNLAKSCIPPVSGSDASWHNMARDLLADLMWRLRGNIGDARLTAARLYYIIANSPRDQLAKLLEGTPAHRSLVGANEKMADSIIGLLAFNLDAWRLIPAIATDADYYGAFSFRRWLENDKDRRRVFLTYQIDQFNALIPFISMVTDLAITYSLSLKESRTRKIWFLIDEIGSLNMLPSLPLLLAQGRKFGGCCIGALQSIAQLQEDHRYGRLGAQSLLSNFNTTIVFRQGDAETAEYFSRHFGEQEVWRDSKGRTHTMGKTGGTTENVSTQLHRQRLYDYTYLMNLPDLWSIVKVPAESAAHMRVRLQNLRPVNKAFEGATTVVNHGDLLATLAAAGVFANRATA